MCAVPRSRNCNAKEVLRIEGNLQLRDLQLRVGLAERLDEDIIGGGLGSTLDLDQLHIEVEGGVGGDGAGGTASAIGDLVGEGDLPLVALAHHLEGLGPAGDNLIGSEVNGLIAAVGRVEDATVNEGTLVVAGALGADEGEGGAGALLEDLHEKARGELEDASLSGLLDEVRATLLHDVSAEIVSWRCVMLQ